MSPWTCACSPSGPVAGELASCFRRDGSDRALIVDPGDEADKLLDAIDALGVTLDGILITHTHFDHVGAVAPVARATGAEVWVPELEKPRAGRHHELRALARIRPVRLLGRRAHAGRAASGSSWPGFEIDVLFTPGHSPGHVTFSIPDEQAIFSGDVLFQGSVGRTDLPGGDWATLLESIRTLVDSLPDETDGLPGPHGNHHARRRAGNQPVPDRAGAGREDGRRSSRPRGARSTCCPRTAGAGALRAHLPRSCSARPATARSRRPIFEEHRAVRARGGGDHRHRPEGDVHLRGPGRSAR